MQALVIFLLVLAPLSWIIAAEPLSVVINEIAWMGAETGWYYEWIELSNNTDHEIDLSGWKIDNGGEKNETLEIPEGRIPPKGYFLICKKEIEKYDFTTWDLSLHNDYNQNGKLILKNEVGIILDETPEPSDSKWPAGDKESYKTMERKSPLVSGNNLENWQTSRYPGGTPKAKNSQVPAQPSEEIPKEADPISPPTSFETPPSEPEPKVYPSNIFISEILPSPKGADAENEWIEIFNGNNFEVALSGWQIRDMIGATKTHTIPEGIKIGSNGFLVLLRTETKITLQNSGDGLELLDPNGEVVHKVNYPKAPLEQSFNRISTGWAWSETLTPGKTNIITIPEALETEPSETFGEKEGQIDSGQSEESKKVLAKIGEQLPKPSSPLIVFLIAFIIAVSSGIIVLFLKKRIASEEL